MRYSFRTLFVLRRKQAQKEDSATIYIRITISGKSIEFSSKIDIDPTLWIQKSQRLSGRTRNAQEINESLIKISVHLQKLYDEIREREGILTPEKLKDAFFGKRSFKQKYLLSDLFSQLIAQKQELATGGAVKAESVEPYLITKDKLREYIRVNYPHTEIDIDKIDYRFIKGFEIYLQGKNGCGHNTMIRHLRHLKQVTTFAYRNGYVSKDPFYNIPLSAKKTERAFLTEEELKKIIMLNLADGALKKVRDIFVFQCLSGLSYIDVKQLKHRDIVDETIVIHRQKTGNKSFIPVLRIARILIDKYTIKRDPNSLVFPVYVSQRMNLFLKMIGKLSGINKILSSPDILVPLSFS